MKKSKIMIFEDQTSISNLIKEILEASGYIINGIFKNANDGIKFLKEQLPDLILMDIILIGQMTGIEAAEIIKDKWDIPIIFLTSNTNTETFEKAKLLGADGYLLKDNNLNFNIIFQIEFALEKYLFEKDLKETQKYLINANERYLSQVNDLNELNEKLSIANKKLQESESKLKEALDTKNKFFSIISHDLKSPLTGLINLTDIMESEVDSLSTEEIREMSKALNNSANAQYKLLTDLLEWSQIQIGSIPYHPVLIDLFEIATETKCFLNQMALNKNIILIQNIEKNTFVFCDKNIVTTIFRNLVTNAIKFFRAG